MSRVDDLQKEILRLRAWIDDLQSGMYINCVYCGHRYGPKDKVATSMQDALKVHVSQCPEHPMHQVLAVLKSGRDLVESAFANIAAIHDGPTRAEAQAWIEQANTAIAKAEFVKPARTTRAPSRAASGARKSSSGRKHTSGVERSDKR